MYVCVAFAIVYYMLVYYMFMVEFYVLYTIVMYAVYYLHFLFCIGPFVFHMMYML